ACGIDASGNRVAPFRVGPNAWMCAAISSTVYLPGSKFAVNDTALSAQYVWYICWNSSISVRDRSAADCTMWLAACCPYSCSTSASRLSLVGRLTTVVLAEYMSGSTWYPCSRYRFTVSTSAGLLSENRMRRTKYLAKMG